MKKMISLFIVLGLLGLTGCSGILTTVKKNIETEKELPFYTLNQENFEEITNQEKTYRLSEEEIEQRELEEPIGKVSVKVTIDEDRKVLTKEELRKVYVVPEEEEEKRYHLNFGWVHRIKEEEVEDVIAVNVNHKYYKAYAK